LQKQIGRHCDLVFSFKGKPIEQVRTAGWYKALARSSIGDFYRHDLRHTWTSWHIQSGTPLNVLQQLDEWGSHSMVQRWAQLAAGPLAPWVDRVSETQKSRGTNRVQRQMAWSRSGVTTRRVTTQSPA
jgi:integrase